MALPIRQVAMPASLKGQQNGKLSPSVLASTPGQLAGPDVRLTRPADRAWRALCAEARKAGHILKISGPSSAYRTYAMQELIFLQRYTTRRVATTYKVWNGQKWYKLPGVATAAVPGTSNHGWGLACDVGEERDGDSGTESIDKGTLNWLVDNELRFGWSHEIQSEAWHIRYFTGDHIPAAVLDYEDSLLPTPPRPTPPPLPPTIPTEDDDMPYPTIIIIDGTHVGKVYMVTPKGPVWVVNREQLEKFQAGKIVSDEAPTQVNSKQLGEWIGAD